MVPLTHLTQQKIDIMLLSSSQVYTLQNNTKIDGQIIPAGELFVKAQYLFPLKKTLIGIWRKPLKQNIIVTTQKIIHPKTSYLSD